MIFKWLSYSGTQFKTRGQMFLLILNMIQYRTQCFGLQFDKTVPGIICSHLDGRTLVKYICFLWPKKKK